MAGFGAEPQDKNSFNRFYDGVEPVQNFGKLPTFWELFLFF